MIDVFDLVLLVDTAEPIRLLNYIERQVVMSRDKLRK